MKSKYLAVILAASMLMTGCSAAWISTFDSILAAAAPALINILQIIAVAEGKPFNTALASKVTGDAATLKSLALAFGDASAAAAPGVCSQLQAAISTYNSDQQQVLSLIQVTDPATQTKLMLLASLVSGTVSALTAVIPSCQANPATFKAEPPLKVATFVQHYNAILTAKTGNAVVDKLTPRLKIHQHSAFVRYSTLGLLK